MILEQFLAEIVQLQTDAGKAPGLEAQISTLQAQINTLEATHGDDTAALAAAAAENLILKARIAALEPPPVVIEPAPAFSLLPVKKALTFAGDPYEVQTPRVLQAADGQLRLAAHGGDFVPEIGDQPRQFRTEIVGTKRYAKGERMLRRYDVMFEDLTVDQLQWLLFEQIHQADTHWEPGVYNGNATAYKTLGPGVTASPIFQANILMKDGKPYVRVQGETSTGDHRVAVPGGWQTQYDPTVRILGVSKAPIPLKTWIPVELIFIDGHGGPGHVRYQFGDDVIVDADMLTGRAYVDTFAGVPYGPRPQPTGSYFKLGPYGGIQGAVAPPATQGASIRYRDRA